jgi:hypothetical protein
MEFEKVTLSKEWILNHEKRLAKMMIRDPWSDPVFRKNGLYEMYIIDTIGEVINLPIELDNDLNPEYTSLKDLIEKVLDTDAKADFLNLLQFIEGYLNRKITLKQWTNIGNVAIDIRLLDTIEECMTWLYGRLKDV